jgi:hypothetical protein
MATAQEPINDDQVASTTMLHGLLPIAYTSSFVF